MDEDMMAVVDPLVGGRRRMTARRIVDGCSFRHIPSIEMQLAAIHAVGDRQGESLRHAGRVQRLIDGAGYPLSADVAPGAAADGGVVAAGDLAMTVVLVAAEELPAAGAAVGWRPRHHVVAKR